MTPLRPPKGQKMLVKLPFWKVPGEKVGVWDHVSMYPMPTPEILSFFPQESQAEQPLSRDLWEPWGGNHRWDGLIPWMGPFLDWLVEEIPKRQKKSKNLQK